MFTEKNIDKPDNSLVFLRSKLTNVVVLRTGDGTANYKSFAGVIVKEGIKSVGGIMHKPVGSYSTTWSRRNFDVVHGVLEL